MVPAEGIEPPTFGLQNRCSTAELSRPVADARLGERRSVRRPRLAPETPYHRSLAVRNEASMVAIAALSSCVNKWPQVSPVGSARPMRRHAATTSRLAAYGVGVEA